jgi:hypothetical protein
MTKGPVIFFFSGKDCASALFRVSEVPKSIARVAMVDFDKNVLLFSI